MMISLWIFLIIWCKTTLSITNADRERFQRIHSERINHNQQQLTVKHNTPPPPKKPQQPTNPPPPTPVLNTPSVSITPLEPNDLITNAFIAGNHSKEFEQMYEKFSIIFDDHYPNPHELYKRQKKTGPFYSDQDLSNLHGVRCIVHQSHQVKDAYIKEKFLPWLKEAIPNQATFHPEAVLVNTPCLMYQSLGNFLSDYFENVMCSYFTGMHFLSVSFVWDPRTNDQVSPFFSTFHRMIEHPKPVNNLIEGRQRIEHICNCPLICHEDANALWTKGVFLIRPILKNAIRYQYEEIIKTNKHQHTIIRSEDQSYLPVNQTLPLIPNVAIHYRCSDNFVGPYGFLPFRAFKEILQEQYNQGNINTIFVLAETKHRTGKNHQVESCNQIFASLFQYLTTTFPKSNILIRRGDDIYTDFVRLSYANITICSASTFCLYPAIYQGSKAYVPRTNLIVKGNTALNLGFHWISNPSIVLGAPYAHGASNQLLNALQS